MTHTGIKEILQGYHQFRDKYVDGDQAIMQSLSAQGQAPKILVVACCDSRVDPALIFQCDPGDLFVIRNVANIVPPDEKDEAHHGTSAALEFAIKVLNVKHLILLGHSSCGGIQALLTQSQQNTDYIQQWMSLLTTQGNTAMDPDEFAKYALNQSYKNCLTFPWIKERVNNQTLVIHRWFFDIQQGELSSYEAQTNQFTPLPR